MKEKYNIVIRIEKTVEEIFQYTVTAESADDAKSIILDTADFRHAEPTDYAITYNGEPEIVSCLTDAQQKLAEDEQRKAHLNRERTKLLQQVEELQKQIDQV